MATHVYNKHVLRLEWLFTARTSFPAADECLLVALNVIVVDVFDQLVLGHELDATVAPMAIGLDEVTWLIFNVRCVRRGTVVFVELMTIWMTIVVVAEYPMPPTQGLVPLPPLQEIRRCAVCFNLGNAFRCRRRLLDGLGSMGIVVVL